MYKVNFSVEENARDLNADIRNDTLKSLFYNEKKQVHYNLKFIFWGMSK